MYKPYYTLLVYNKFLNGKFYQIRFIQFICLFIYLPNYSQVDNCVCCLLYFIVKISPLDLSTKRAHCYHMLDQVIRMLKWQQPLHPVYGQHMKRTEKWPSIVMSLKWSSWIARFVSVHFILYQLVCSWILSNFWLFGLLLRVRCKYVKKCLVVVASIHMSI